MQPFIRLPEEPNCVLRVWPKGIWSARPQRFKDSMKHEFLSRSAVAVAAACLLSSFGAHAEDGISTTFSGYGTVAGTFTNDGDVEFTPYSNMFKGPTNELDVGFESRLGVQGTARFDSRFSATAQVLAQRRGAKDFSPGVEWLYGQYSPVDSLDVRLGRVVLPAFLLSDSRYVGYAQTWLRAPTEVYGQMPFSSLDGVQALWHKSVGPAVISAQVSYGTMEATLDLGPIGTMDIHGRDSTNVSVGVELGSWTLRAAQTRTNSAMNLPLAPGMNLDFTDHDKFMDLGAQYDDGRAIVMGEWVRRTENDVPGFGMPLIASTSWYVAAGWRFGSLTPMAHWAGTKNDGSLLNSAATHSVGLSLRYDVARNVDLKFQVDRYDAASQFSPAAATTGTKIDVFAFAADFVF